MWAWMLTALVKYCQMECTWLRRLGNMVSRPYANQVIETHVQENSSVVGTKSTSCNFFFFKVTQPLLREKKKNFIVKAVIV